MKKTNHEKPNNSPDLSTILKKVLKNAAQLQLSELKISDIISRTASDSKRKEVRPLYTSSVKVDDKVRCKFYHEMPYHPLPNASKYSIGKGNHSWLAAIFGTLEGRSNSNEVLNWRNIYGNRHIKYRFNQLGHLRDRNKSAEYWRLGTALLRNPVFQMMALNHVCPNFHTQKREVEIKRIYENLQEIIKEKKVSVALHRFYIAKANKKWRPIGAPEIPWRVYLHMWNCLIVWWRQGKDRNHAFFPKKGIHTAWLEILPKLMKSEDVYEFDLESFFPNVNITEIEKLMVEKLEIPIGVAHYIMELHRCITILPKDRKMEEKSDLTALLTPSNEVNPNLSQPLKDQVKKVLTETAEEKRIEELHRILPSGWSIYRTHGVPQGTATSCGVATISLYYIWQLLGEKLVMYADDGILFPSNQKDVENLSDRVRGISKSESKSGWVKVKRQWQKSLKFLGLTFYPQTENSEVHIKSSTRNGAALEFNIAAQLLTFLKIEWDKCLLKHGKKGEVGYQSYPYRPYSRNKSAKEEEVHQKHKPEKHSPILVKDWIMEMCKRFEQLSSLERLSLLFKEKGLRSLAAMFNGSWNIPAYLSPRQYVRGSWLHIHGGRFIRDEIKRNSDNLLTILYWKKMLKKFPDAGKNILGGSKATSVWSGKWVKLTPSTDQNAAEKLHNHMLKMLETIVLQIDSDAFDYTLDSLFKWNIAKPKGPIDKPLQEVLKELCKNFPYDVESLSTMAISDYLKNGFSASREIRRCMVLKTKRSLISRLGREKETKVIVPRGAYKDFKRDFNTDFKQLIHVLES